MDMQHQLSNLNLAFDRDVLDVNTVSSKNEKFHAWLDDFAVRESTDELNSATCTKPSVQCSGDRLPAVTHGSTFFEKALHHVAVHDVNVGLTQKPEFRYTPIAADGSEKKITMQDQDESGMPTKEIKNALNEIKEAAREL